MSTTRRLSLRRLARQRKHGQSIPIIALMIVVLIGMVALSVDVGNTFNHEREAVSASNAASLAAMKTYIQGKSYGVTGADIYTVLTDSLKSNGITPGDGLNGTTQVASYYVNSQGEDISAFGESSGVAPENVTYIKVKLEAKVDTSFARIVGQNELPINASAYASNCPLNSVVYPIGVDSATITGSSFNKTGMTDPNSTVEYQELSSGYAQRRLYVKGDTSTAGNFGWLRWMKDKGANGSSANSNPELTASLIGEGNIGSGFEEAPPSDETDAAYLSGEYPTEKGYINDGDWVWVYTGSSFSSSVKSALDQLRANNTKIILPIYNQVSVQNGANGRVRVSDLGAFELNGYGKENGKDYFDLVYYGDPIRQENACIVKAPSAEEQILNLSGDVTFYPEYAISEASQKPIQYVVIFDASGSMSANFDGQCNRGYNNSLNQCTNGPVGASSPTVDNVGNVWYWSPENERRIYVAKEALKSLVKLTNMPDNPGYVSTKPNDQMSVIWFNQGVSESNVMPLSSSATSLSNFITTINNGYGNYRSEGGTNGAAGLYRAARVLENASKTTSFKGQDVEYKRVVLFITDGVSNFFLNTAASDLKGPRSQANTYPETNACFSLGASVLESALCQMNEVGGLYQNMSRPISQMMEISEEQLRNSNLGAEIFVLALSNIPSIGLKGVATSDSYFFSADKLEKNADGSNNVQNIITEINTQVETTPCVPGPNGSTTGAVSSNEFVNGTGGFTYPQVGLVTIKDGSNTFTAPIKAADDGSNLLSYEFKAIPEGTYIVTARLYYHHPEDAAGVMREYSKIWSAGQPMEEYTVEVRASSQDTSFTQTIKLPITLKINGEVCAES